MSHYITWTNEELLDYLISLTKRAPEYSGIAVENLRKQILSRMAEQNTLSSRLLKLEREYAIAKGLQDDDD